MVSLEDNECCFIVVCVIDLHTNQVDSRLDPDGHVSFGDGIERHTELSISKVGD